MIYKTFEEWKAGQWLEDGEPRTKAYTKDELLLVEIGWNYGFGAGKETANLTDEEIMDACITGGIYDCINDPYMQKDGKYSLDVDLIRFAKAILRKAQEK